MTLVVHWGNGNKSIFANMRWEITSVDNMLKLYYFDDGYRAVHLEGCQDPMGDSSVYHVFTISNEWEEYV